MSAGQVVSSREAEIVPPCRSSQGVDETLVAVARKALRASGYSPLRKLHCEVTDAIVIVRGVLPSWHLKQMAQVFLQRLDGIRGVQNLVEVKA